MTYSDVAIGTMIMMVPLIVCAGIIGFFIGEAYATSKAGKAKQ